MTLPWLLSSRRWPGIVPVIGLDRVTTVETQAQRQEEGSGTNACDQIPEPHASLPGPRLSSQSASILTVEGFSYTLLGIDKKILPDALNDDDNKKQQRSPSTDNAEGSRQVLPSTNVVRGVKDEKN